MKVKSILFSLILIAVLVSSNVEAAGCLTVCNYGDCVVSLNKEPTSWSISVVCGDGFTHP